MTGKYPKSDCPTCHDIKEQFSGYSGKNAIPVRICKSCRTIYGIDGKIYKDIWWSSKLRREKKKE